MLLYFGSVSLLVSALLLILSALVKRPDPRLNLCDGPRKVGQLASDKGYVPLGCHFAQKSTPVPQTDPLPRLAGESEMQTSSPGGFPHFAGKAAPRGP